MNIKELLNVNDVKEKFEKKTFLAKKRNENWNTEWKTLPTYSCFQKQTVKLLELSIDSNNFLDLTALTDDQTSELKDTILTIMALGINFADILDYDIDSWLENEN